MSRAERLAPGDGSIDIAIGLEVPMNEITHQAGHEAVARHAREGLRRNLGI